MNNNEINNKLNIIFMGTPEFSTKPLERILSSQHNIIAIYTKSPKRQGRGQNIELSPVHQLANKNNIPVFTPQTLRNEEVQAEFLSHKADLAIVVAYGLILPKPILEAPKYGCINIHASLLPRWRGAAPIQRAILSGDKQTGITLMQMDEGLDTGDIINLRKINIDITTTTTILQQQLAQLSGEMIVDLLNNFTQLTKIPQQHNLANYADKLTKDESIINWFDTAYNIHCKIRALNPWPGTFCKWNNKSIKLLNSQITNKPCNSEPGTVEISNNILYVACRDQWIIVNRLQLSGKPIINSSDLINGYGVKNITQFN